MQKESIVIVAARRTPLGGLLGDLAGLSASDLGAAAIRAAVEQAGVPAPEVDTVLFGCVLGAGQAPGGARASVDDLQHGAEGLGRIVLQADDGDLARPHRNPRQLCLVRAGAEMDGLRQERGKCGERGIVHSGIASQSSTRFGGFCTAGLRDFWD